MKEQSAGWAYPSASAAQFRLFFEYCQPSLSVRKSAERCKGRAGPVCWQCVRRVRCKRRRLRRKQTKSQRHGPAAAAERQRRTATHFGRDTTRSPTPSGWRAGGCRRAAGRAGHWPWSSAGARPAPAMRCRGATIARARSSCASPRAAAREKGVGNRGGEEGGLTSGL